MILKTTGTSYLILFFKTMNRTSKCPLTRMIKSVIDLIVTVAKILFSFQGYRRDEKPCF